MCLTRKSFRTGGHRPTKTMVLNLLVQQNRLKTLHANKSPGSLWLGDPRYKVYLNPPPHTHTQILSWNVPSLPTATILIEVLALYILMTCKTGGQTTCGTWEWVRELFKIVYRIQMCSWVWDSYTVAGLLPDYSSLSSLYINLPRMTLTMYIFVYFRKLWTNNVALDPRMNTILPQ